MPPFFWPPNKRFLMELFLFMNTPLKSLVLVLLVMTSFQTHAKYCDGKIEDWEVAKWGTLYVDGDWNSSNESHALCKLDGTRNGVSVETCKAWLLTVQDAASRNLDVRLKYLDIQDCDSQTIGTWSNAKTPEYIRVYSK